MRNKSRIVFDSTGWKVFGKGEWEVHKQGYNKRRIPMNRDRLWRKLHLGVDEYTGLINSEVLTKNEERDGDSHQFTELPEQVQGPIDRVTGDGVYDTLDIWDILILQEIEGHIPTQEHAVYQTDL